MMEEANLLQKIKCPEHIVGFEDIFVEEDNIFIVMEKMDMNMLSYINWKYDKLTEA